MSFNEVIRQIIFWTTDLIKGGQVRQNYKDIERIMISSDNSFVKNEIDKRLNRLLIHAIETTTFYKNIDISLGIQSFPTIDKNLIRENISDFLSNKYSQNERIPAITSGSTGTPFKTFQGKAKKYRNTADTLFFANLAGYNLGNKLYYMKIWSEYNKKTWILQKIQNIVPIDVLNLKRDSKAVINQLNANKSSISLLGYVSAYETLCKELDKENIIDPKLKVNSILTMSEGLNDYTKVQGEKYFKCPVLSRYSNIENGIIAQQTLLDKDNFTINRASYLVEIMDMEKDVPVAEGELGRIVVTDFFNEVMPMIRYDTGDLGIKVVKEINGLQQQVLNKIEGRKLDQIYNTKGELVSSYIVYKNMWNYTEIDQYQLIQKNSNAYVMKICLSNVFNRESQLVNEFKEYLGADADFKVEYVNEIPLLNSGKRKKVMNEMNLGN